MVKAYHRSAPHTAGIFCDMTIDGPQIGTLVIIVDRAKNLPNRKTIGKQDPYCAARLGKEARKTTTDMRGGQTPKWDQELRFTVHDSPDYYQLKVSIFNDDKRTELIGETWIDLRDIVVPGGGQNDLWQNLTCKGKYAGEIRIEITYYDSRPKPERSAAKPNSVTNSDADFPPSGEPQQAVAKRRPLPSDPSSQSGSGPAPVSPRQQPNPPSRDQVSADHTNPLALYPANKPPSQLVSNNNSSLRHRQAEPYSPGPKGTYHTNENNLDIPHRPSDPCPVYPEDIAYSPDHHGHTPDKKYALSTTRPGASPSNVSHGPEQIDERPPPPPVHRSTPGTASETQFGHGHELVHQNLSHPEMRKEVLRSEAHRKSASSSAYPGRPTYVAYNNSAPKPSGPHNPRSYDTAYDSQYRSMQATVEDVPDSPGAGFDNNTGRRVETHAPEFSEPDCRQIQDPSPAPLSLRGRGSAPRPTPSTASLALSAQKPTTSLNYARSDPSLVLRDYKPLSVSEPLYDSQPQNTATVYCRSSQLELEDNQIRAATEPIRSAFPSVPSSLIPGVDQSIMDISHGLNDERRQGRQQPAVTQPTALAAAAGAGVAVRGCPMTESPPSYKAAPPEIAQRCSTLQHRHHSYDSPDPSSLPTLEGPSTQQAIKRREVSPNLTSRAQTQYTIKVREFSSNSKPFVQHTIKRKSVSPTPQTDICGLSAIPFGPDSYDALNPNIVATASKEPVQTELDENSGMIITHDGKEIDPSDHLPMDTWAPEPEPKGKKPFRSAVPRLSGPQPIPPSGRKPLRIRETRPNSAIVSYEFGRQDLPPPTTGRNRLQKKTGGSRPLPIVMSGANGPGPGPLAPLSEAQDGFVPQPPYRASTFDCENNAPAPIYDTSPTPQSRIHSTSAPPVPAKIPLTTDSVERGYGDLSGQSQAMVEEMSRIVIGTGRARRHGQRAGY